MIISLFGPDGVGKSTIAQELRKAGWTVFSGTDVASWPDQSWHRELVKRGIDETSFNNDEHFIEKIKRAHTLAKTLEKQQGTVVIDSDPLHKTLMHDFLRSLPDVEAGRLLMRKRFIEFKRLTSLQAVSFVHVNLQISDTLPDEEQAQIAQQRIHKRGALAFFDPKDINQSLALILACRELRLILEASVKMSSRSIPTSRSTQKHFISRSSSFDSPF
jgi:dephospho-CoA kinase